MEPLNETDLSAVFASWVDSPMKVRLSVFFYKNPGVIETPEGLARRLGVNEVALAPAVKDHVRLGLLKSRAIGKLHVLLYDRRRRAELDAFIQEAVGEHENRGAGP